MQEENFGSGPRRSAFAVLLGALALAGCAEQDSDKGASDRHDSAGTAGNSSGGGTGETGGTGGTGGGTAGGSAHGGSDAGAGGSGGSPAASGFRTVGEMVDGSVRDLAVDDHSLLIAQGRNLARLDWTTGLRLDNHPGSPFSNSLRAVEYDLESRTLAVATTQEIHVYDETGAAQIWTAAGVGEISDMKFAAPQGPIVVSTGSGLVVLERRGGTIVELGRAPVPPDLVTTERLYVAEVNGRLLALVVGVLSGSTARGQNGLAVIDLDSASGFSEPQTLTTWDPVPALGAGATVKAVRVAGGAVFVASGNAQLTELDLSVPSTPTVSDRFDIHPGWSVDNLEVDPHGDRLYVASTNNIHIFSVQSRSVVGSKNLSTANGCDRDMPVRVADDGDRSLFTGLQQTSDWLLQGITVTGEAPESLWKQWWISSSDGGTAVPEWDSVYLPTFGGVARYDVSDPTAPKPTGYQPGGHLTEHIDIVFTDPTDRTEAFLLTAPATGGWQMWPISRDNPDPGPPTTLAERPASFGSDKVYQNDVTAYQRDGKSYLLADLANRRTDAVALQVYDINQRRWHNAIETHPELIANGKQVEVGGDHAFVSVGGGFFIVDLSGLPDTVSVTDEVTVDVNRDGTLEDAEGLAFDSSASRLFIATDEKRAVLTYTFDATSGRVTGPTAVFTDPAMTGSTSRLRYHAATQRLYLPSRKGLLFEIGAPAQGALTLLDTWQAPGYTGEMQDARLFDFGNGPRVLVVTNNGGFAILDPDDDL